MAGATHLLVIAGTDHDEAVTAREDLVRDDRRVRRAVAPGLILRDKIVRSDVREPRDLAARAPMSACRAYIGSG